LASEDTIIGATLQLARDVEYYADPLLKYPDEMIDELRVTCENALHHGDVASVEHLDSLAVSVMRHLDAPWLCQDWRPAIVNCGGAETILNSDLADDGDFGGR
jgi:hypothetical protein